MDVLELLSELVSFNTVNDPNKGIKPSKECPRFIKDQLDSWDIESEIIERSGYYAVYGEIGDGTPRLLFMAHFDVVPVNLEEWETDPFELTIKENKAYGRGSADDKGNVAAVMLALKELSKEEKLNGRVIFAFTGDEEIGGAMAMHIAEKLSKEGKVPKYMINADGIGMKPIIRRRKGFGVEIKVYPRKVKVKGRVREIEFEPKTPVVETRHAAYFLPGVDTHPMVALSHFLRNSNAVAISLDGAFIKGNVIPGKVKLKYVEPGEGEEVEGDLSLTALLKAIVPIVRAPIKAEKYSDYGVSITPNVYSFDGSHVLKVDVRAMSYSKDDIEKTLREVLNFNLPEAELIIKENEKAGYLFTSPDDELVRVTLRILKELGEDVEPIEGPGASDSRYFTPLGVKAIDIGPRGGNIHGPNEYVEVDSLRKMPEIYRRIALSLLL
ncbi:M20/M25/M40 family metallo-hydrolase [Pyrococcus horikoshii]|nr:M20/M25/M40 family metallo-hydrolase [Pyrococcus horikoshii]